MIDEQSKRNIEVAFHKAVRAHLVREPRDACDIVAAAEPSSGGNLPADKLLLITLSSFVYRLLMIFRIVENPATRAYYVAGGATQTLDEVFAELVNMCGGALNREMSTTVSHLAMSTPYTVSGQCIGFLSELKPQYVSSYLITVNDTVQIQATLCMSCSAPVEIAPRTAASEVEDRMGELELF